MNNTGPVSRRGTIISAVKQKERTPKRAKNSLKCFGLGVVLYIAQFELFFFQLLCIYGQLCWSSPRAKIHWVHRVSKKGSKSPKYLSSRPATGTNTTPCHPPSPPSRSNQLHLIKAPSNHPTVPVSADRCTNAFFKSWNSYLPFSAVGCISDRGRGCLFSMQRGSVTKCTRRTVWQNIKQVERDEFIAPFTKRPTTPRKKNRKLWIFLLRTQAKISSNVQLKKKKKWVANRYF